MSATELYETTPGGPVFNGQDDRISDAGIKAILHLFDLMPESWELGPLQCHLRSVTATIRFDTVGGPTAQADALENCLQAAACLGALVRNLAWERARADFFEQRASVLGSTKEDQA